MQAEDSVVHLLQRCGTIMTGWDTLKFYNCVFVGWWKMCFLVLIWQTMVEVRAMMTQGHNKSPNSPPICHNIHHHPDEDKIVRNIWEIKRGVLEKSCVTCLILVGHNLEFPAQKQ